MNQTSEQIQLRTVIVITALSSRDLFLYQPHQLTAADRVIRASRDNNQLNVNYRECEF